MKCLIIIRNNKEFGTTRKHICASMQKLILIAYILIEANYLKNQIHRNGVRAKLLLISWLSAI